MSVVGFGLIADNASLTHNPINNPQLANQVADQVRWRVRRDFPTVSEVLVHTKTEPLPCPVANDLRPPQEIEKDVRARLAPEELREPRMKEVRKVTVHYVSMQPLVEVLLRVEPSLTVEGAGEIARRVQGVVEGVKDVNRAEVYLDLTGGIPSSSSSASAVGGLAAA